MTATLTVLSCTPADQSDSIAHFFTAFRPLSLSDGVSVAALYLGELDEIALSASVPTDPDDIDYADFLDVSIELDQWPLPALRVDLLPLQIRSLVTLGQSQVSEIVYTSADLDAENLTRRFGFGDLLQTALHDLLSPSNTDIRIDPGQEGLLAGRVGGAVSTLLAVLPDQVLTTLAVPLDAILDDLLATAGLTLGQGELILTGYHFMTVQLAQ